MKSYNNENEGKLIKNFIKNFSIILVMQIILYLVQFIIIPIFIFPKPTDKTLNDTIWLVSTSLFVLVSMWSINDKILFWIISSPIYYSLMNFYIPKGLYRINYSDSIFGNMTSPSIEIVAIQAVIIEVLVWIVVKCIKLLIKTINKRKNNL